MNLPGELIERSAKRVVCTCAALVSLSLEPTDAASI